MPIRNGHFEKVKDEFCKEINEQQRKECFQGRVQVVKQITQCTEAIVIDKRIDKGE
jgi:hypothetical protein